MSIQFFFLIYWPIFFSCHFKEKFIRFLPVYLVILQFRGIHTHTQTDTHRTYIWWFSNPVSHLFLMASSFFSVLSCIDKQLSKKKNAHLTGLDNILNVLVYSSRIEPKRIKNSSFSYVVFFCQTRKGNYYYSLAFWH